MRKSLAERIRQFDLELAALFMGAAAFSFLILSAPVTSTIFYDTQVHIFFLAPMIAGAIAALGSIWFLSFSRWRALLTCSFFAATLGFGAALFLLKLIQSSVDSSAIELFTKLPSLMTSHARELAQENYVLYAVAAICVPFLFHGFGFSVLFARAPKDRLRRLYSFELVGMVAGLLAGLGLLELASYRSVLIFLCLSSAMSVTILLPRSRLWLGTPVFLLLALFTLSPHYFEPERDLNLAARDWRFLHRVESLAKGWTSYAKVQLLEVERAKGTDSRKIISIGDGAGIARVSGRKNGEIYFPQHLPDILGGLFPARDALVLFAGAGADLVTLSKANPQARITGVEINDKILEFSKREPSSPINHLQGNSRTKLVNAEARNFLEKTSQKYDLILFSWSGATMAQFSGAVLHTTQYAFTTESLQRAMDLLNPDGHMIIMGGSKVNLTVSLMRNLELRNSMPAEKSVFLVSSKTIENDLWRNNWDDMALVYKNGNLNETELAHLDSRLSANGFTVRHPKVDSSPEFKPIYNLLNSPNYESGLNQLRLDTRIHYEPVTDDRPFARPGDNQHFKSEMKWLHHQFQQWVSNPLQLDRLGLAFFILFTIGLINAAEILTLRPQTGSPLLRFINLPLASLTGFFFAATLIIWTYKAILEVGNPTAAMALAQGLGIGLSFSGSMLAAKFWSARRRRNSLLALGLWLAILFLSDLLNLRWVFPLAIAPLIFFSSVFFVCGLEFSRCFRPATTGLYYALNVLGAALGAAAIPVLVETFGIRATTSLSMFVFVGAAALFALGHWRHTSWAITGLGGAKT